MGLGRLIILAALVGCVVSSSISLRPNAALYPRQRRGSDQRLAELEALLTLTKFIKEKQAQEAMFENIGKRRKRRQLGADGLVPLDDGGDIADGAGVPGALPFLGSGMGWDAPDVAAAPSGSIAAAAAADASDDGGSLLADVDPPVRRYPWNRYKSQQQQLAKKEGAYNDDQQQQQLATAAAAQMKPATEERGQQ